MNPCFSVNMNETALISFNWWVTEINEFEMLNKMSEMNNHSTSYED